jgi:hypothetical protein
MANNKIHYEIILKKGRYAPGEDGIIERLDIVLEEGQNYKDNEQYKSLNKRRYMDSTIHLKENKL